MVTFWFSCRSETPPLTVLRTTTVGSNVTLTSVLQAALWTVRLPLLRKLMVPAAPRPRTWAAPLAPGLGVAQSAASPPPPAKFPPRDEGEPPEDVAAPGADGFADSDLPSPLGHGHEHDVHDSDTTHHQ